MKIILLNTALAFIPVIIATLLFGTTITEYWCAAWFITWFAEVLILKAVA